VWPDGSGLKVAAAAAVPGPAAARVRLVPAPGFTPVVATAVGTAVGSPTAAAVAAGPACGDRVMVMCLSAVIDVWTTLRPR